MKRFTCVALVALALVAATVVQATTGLARTRLDAFSHDLHALTGRFMQTLTDANGQNPKTSAGTLALQAPREFRWDTTTPFQQTIVADGRQVWLYDPDLQQVTVREQSTEEAHSPLTVITDLKRLDRDYRVVEQGEHDGLSWLRLTSTAKDPSFDYADLGFDANGLARMRFRDQLGATTDIQFSDWRRNPSLPPANFRFVPPKGTDVIGDTPVITTPIAQ